MIVIDELRWLRARGQVRELDDPQEGRKYKEWDLEQLFWPDSQPLTPSPTLARHPQQVPPEEPATANVEPIFDHLATVGKISGTEKEPKPKLFGPDIFGWGGGLPREGVGAKKFGMSLETQGIKLFWRNIPGFVGISQKRPKSLRKKMFGFNSRPLKLSENGWKPSKRGSSSTLQNESFRASQRLQGRLWLESEVIEHIDQKKRERERERERENMQRVCKHQPACVQIAFSAAVLSQEIMFLAERAHSLPSVAAPKSSRGSFENFFFDGEALFCQRTVPTRVTWEDRKFKKFHGVLQNLSEKTTPPVTPKVLGEFISAIHSGRKLFYQLIFHVSN